MSYDSWFVSDTHFGHAKVLTFLKDDNDPTSFIRPGFTSVEQMDEALVDNWNSVVKDGDRVYHLGDVGFDRDQMAKLMPRLKGRKRLILGNHDEIKEHRLTEYFQKIHLWRIFKDEGFVCSHIPLMPDQFRHKVVLNVHGHIHEKPDPSPLHMNISVERTNYTPIHLDEILARVATLRD